MADLSLLFQLRGDNAHAKATFADSERAVTRLRAHFGNELKQMQGVARTAVAGIGEDLESFVAQRIPLIGGTFQRVTTGLRGLNEEMRRGGPQTQRLAEQIDAISKASGKSTTEVSRFLTTFVRLQGQTARNEAAFKAFGGSVDLIGNKTANLLPQLEQAGETLAAVSTEAAGTGAAMASMAGPIAIAVAALAAQVVVVVTLTKETFNLAKAAADYQGKLFDLSQQVGVSVETLSALEVVARTTGGSIDSLVQSLGIFQKRLEEAVEDRGSKAAKTFRQLGVDATDTETGLRQTIAALARMPEGFRQTALALEVFGRGGKAFLAIAKEANGDIDEITRRLKDLGLVTTDQAKLADEFNDQLVLLQVQLRGLGTQAIPVVLDVLRDLSNLLKENRELFNVLGGIVKANALVIATAFRLIKQELDKVSFVLRVTAELFERIKSAIEFIAGHPIKLPGLAGVPEVAPTQPQTPPDARDPFTEQLRDRVEAQKRLQNVLNSAFAEQQRQAQDRIALAQREFEAGKRTRQQLLDATIDGTRKQTKAEIDALEVERRIKLEEQALAKDDLDKKNQLATAIFAIDTQIANKRAEQDRNEANLRAQARRDEEKTELAHQQALLDTQTRVGQQRIAIIQREIQAGITNRESGLRQIEEIENAASAAREQLLKRELESAGVGPERQSVLDKIKAFEVDRTELQREQSERRIAIAQDEVRVKADAALAEADTLLRIAQTVDTSRIAGLRALAAARVRSEEDTEKAILRIRLAAIDREDEFARIQNAAAKALIDARLNALFEARRSLIQQLEATDTIEDPQKRLEAQIRLRAALQQNVDEEIAAQGEANKERDRLDKELNQQERINNAEREAIQAEGNRDIDRGRQQDLENERRYARELQSIRERINDIQRETARTVIDLMILNHARRRDIIKARAALELKDEQDRHQRELDSIERQRQENAASKKTAEEKLEAEKELNRQKEAELERHLKREEEIKTGAKKDARRADPLGQFDLGTEQFEEFAKTVEESVVPLNQILTDSFFQVAEAIGSVVEQWVLYGETGPAVLRKILAVTLASIAKEAAINAIKQLAVGFALLATGQPGAGAAFLSAALWGSIAGGAAIAGRGVAGDLFKQKPGGSSGGGAGSSGGPDALNPIVQGRNQQQTITIILRPDESAFGRLVTATVVGDIGNGGVIREVINSDGR